MFSKYLHINTRYNLAYSTTGSFAIVLPKIIKIDKKYQCLAKALWTTVEADGFDFLLNQVVISVSLPENLKKTDWLYTPENGEVDLILPVTWLEDRNSWMPPEFRDTPMFMEQLGKPDDDEDKKQWEY